MEFDFPHQDGTGFEKLYPANVSIDVQELIAKLLMYDQAHRMSASQALKDPYFKELRDADQSSVMHPGSVNPRVTNRIGGDSFS